MRWFCVAFLLPFALPSAVRSQESSDLQKVILPFVNKHCITCHGPEKKRAGLDLSTMKEESTFQPKRKAWGLIVQMVQTGEMPPSEKPRPKIDEVEGFAKAVGNVFAKLDKNAKKDPGQVTMRRLNRAEYDNTIRDLLGMDYNASEDLPPDDVGYGFDNIGDVLTISPFLMERYLATAENIITRAFPAKVPAPSQRYLSSRYLEPALRPIDNSLNVRSVDKGNLNTPMNLTQEGEYKIRAKGYGKPLDKEAIEMTFSVDGKEMKKFQVLAVKGKPQTYETIVKLKPGQNRFAVNFTNPEEKDGKKRELMIENLSWEGPLDARPAPQRIWMTLKPGQSETDAIPDILGRFAAKAFRRPVAKDELARLVSLVKDAMAAGETWNQAMQVGFQAVLVSPKFLFRVELDSRPDSIEPHPIDDYQLASRLSYFLWSSMPDDELFDLAAKKQLHQNIEPQVRRMLKDPKSQALIENFALQWLQLRNLLTISPDPNVFPEWDEFLRKAMFAETKMFFDHLLAEDRSVLEIVDCNYTFLNERIAKHYGVMDTLGNRYSDPKKGLKLGNPIKGPNFVKVQLKDGERGGVLTHASVLTITSNPTRTSPVKRGRWILEQILGTPPPPPPPNVPELEEGEKVTVKGTLRQRMEAHRANPACASCHARMDPIGFAFENFNGVGKFRTKDGDFPIDPAGTLPGGQTFQGAPELRSILKEKKELFGRNLAEKMAIYATGRGLEYYDKNAVDKIVAELEKGEYRFSALVTAVAQSDPFRLRRGKGQ